MASLGLELGTVKAAAAEANAAAGRAATSDDSVDADRASARDARLRTMVALHFDIVWRALRRLGVPDAGADDAAQQVFLVAARRLDEIDPPRERQYLLGIALRVASDARHAASRRREVPMGDSHELARQMALADGAPLAEQLLDEKRARAMLASFLESMPTDLREAFVLFELEEMAAPAVAEILGVPVGTVASRVRRARQYVRDHLPRRGAT
jgi:RNA polymerase sigma-70 factor (ECF subfamily)